jgi:hypothetical protein
MDDATVNSCNRGAEAFADEGQNAWPPTLRPLCKETGARQGEPANETVIPVTKNGSCTFWKFFHFVLLYVAHRSSTFWKHVYSTKH